MKNKKPNCYKCTYRGNVPGDTHSCCNYPGLDSDLFTGMFSLKNMEIAKELNIRADRYGIESGWFMWPVNFDPVWLKNCDGEKPTK